jgi:hypothetical protein
LGGDIEDINGHVEHMEKLRRYAELHDDKRVYLGGIAGAVLARAARNTRSERGFMSVRQDLPRPKAALRMIKP